MVTVHEIKKTIIDDKTVLSEKIDCKTLGFNDFELWYRFPKELFPQISVSGNPFVPALVLPSMYAGENLRIEAEVSEKLLEGARKIMQIYRFWYNNTQPIEIEPAGTTAISLPGQYVAEFFSGGVDSFYTLLKNKNSTLPDSEKISHLIFVHGFDIPLDRTELFQNILARIEKVSDAYNKKLVVVSTNVRSLIDNLCPWIMYHGPAMASVALCLEGLVRQIYIASDGTYRNLMPHGSHPLTEPLWSSDSIQIIHDGNEATRIEKIKLQISKDQFALENLRSCFENNDGKYNCGVCVKCMRTKLNLKAAGVLEKCTTFDSQIDNKKVRALKINNRARIYMEDNYRALLEAGADKRLLKAVRYCLSPWSISERKRKYRKIEKAVKKTIKGLVGIK